MANRGLTGVLLVGGASTRFGSPKALALLDGETLAERGWRLLGESCDERLAVGKLRDGLALPFPVFDDEADVRAPLAGVVAGLRAARHDVCVFLPIDCPFLTAVSIRRMGEEVGVAPNGPLPGAYPRSALPVLERRLSEGQLALRSAVQELGLPSVAIDASELVNVNTPDDLASLRGSG